MFEMEEILTLKECWKYVSKAY